MTATTTQAPTSWVEAPLRRAINRKGRRNHALCPTTGKRRFRDRHDAGLELRRLSHQRSSLDAQSIVHGIRVVRAYRCEHCAGWHLTSQPGRARVPQHEPRALPIGIVPARFRPTTNTATTTTADAVPHRAPAAA